MFTDTEAMLMIQARRDNDFAAREMNKANAELRRLRALLAQSQADLEAERGRRRHAESRLARMN